MKLCNNKVQVFFLIFLAFLFVYRIIDKRVKKYKLNKIKLEEKKQIFLLKINLINNKIYPDHPKDFKNVVIIFEIYKFKNKNH